MAKRSKRCDSFGKRFRVFLLQNFKIFWSLIEKIPFVSGKINAYIINTACKAAKYRPHSMSTHSDYVSWSSLTDKTYLGRSIPPISDKLNTPPVEEVTKLFLPGSDGQRECTKSTLLFPVFAQYLTDGFLRTDMKNRAKTTSNHDIDMSPLYGRTFRQTEALREKSEEAGRKGRLMSQFIDGEEFPPSLYQMGTSDFTLNFVDDHGAHLLDLPLGIDDEWDRDEHSQRMLFAVGGDRANSNALVSMMNTLFLREHNRLASELESRHEYWDDTRVFETARNIVIVLFIKIVIEEYINHISSACFKLKADPKVAWHADWNRPNWMTVEFSLLYRWHSLIPETMHWDGKQIDSASLLLNNSSLVQAGLANAFKWVSQTNATKLDLHNTAIFLERNLTVESLAIQQNREQRLQGYNAYRKSMGMKPVDDFDCITADTSLQAELRELYVCPDNIDFYVSLFAEDSGPNSPMPPLLGSMVALDAFSQALNNPLLSHQVFNKNTFTDYGMQIIEDTSTLADILARNTGVKCDFEITSETVRMTRRDWSRQYVSF